MRNPLPNPQIADGLGLPTTIARTRLKPCREAAERARITLLRAPAGYGKTSLLQDWQDAFLRSGAKVLFFSLSRWDTDFRRFWQTLLLATRRAGWPVEFPGDVENSQLAPHFFEELTRLIAGPFVMILDDAHFASDEALADLVDMAPRQVRLIIASRTKLPLPLARLRTLEQLVELGCNELRFDALESEELKAAAGRDEMTERELSRLVEKSEGWPVALKTALAQTSLQPTRAHRLSGCHADLAAYFEEEILAGISPRERTFLTAISILPRLSDDLCRYVSKDELAEQLLYKLHDDGLLISAIDTDHRWLRLHGLLAEYLQHRIPSERLDCRALHMRACDWFYGQGMTQEAFDHAHAAGNMQRAGEILLAEYRGLFACWRYGQFLKMALRLPQEVIEQFPEIGVAMAWPLAVRGQWAHAGALIDAARNSLISIAAEEGKQSESYRRLSFAIAHSEMVRAKYCGQNHLAERQCRELVEHYPDGDPFTLGVVFTSLMLVQCAGFRLKGVEYLNSQAMEQYRLAGVSGPNAFHVKTYARYLATVGRSDEAVDILAQALEDGAEKGNGRHFDALIAIPLCAIHYLRGELTEAENLLRRYREEAEQSNLIDMSIDYWVTRARLVWQRGDTPHAHYILRKGWFRAEAQGSEQFKASIGLERIRLLLASAQPDNAMRVGKELDLPTDIKTLLPESDGTQLNSIRAMCWVRLATTQNRVPDAIRVASAWLSYTLRGLATVDSVGWQLLLSHLYWLNGDVRAAQRCVRSALADASQAGLLRMVLDEGPVIGRLVAEECLRNSGEDGAESAFRTALLEGIRQEMGDAILSCEDSSVEERPICEALTGKELEILSMIGSGNRNVDVASKVGISEGSVKWYLQRIYDKMGVRKRSIAVERARQLGWLR
ncbi:helix-turn-helix transcriptional regulator [Altericroceibacterium endophyticum]|uniref:HTH luxR-type domain-containing protein n=1 Tax=Altericroceibacterium endophyticum TaxID=1808508 RepID=A0A6I4T825_9SPHN|nr:LuxR C-terminal-related transcriptional regulator [Altericroceibacterium endophyticum]MXO66828.1 hypothetical protein [Altericroceibacterium endophyticum]